MWGCSDRFWCCSVVDNLRNPKEVVSELNRLLEKKKSTEEKLAHLERQIYALEGSYLTETRTLGNILVGWDSYLSARSGALKRPQKHKESDRLFSLSSVTSIKVSMRAYFQVLMQLKA